MIPQPAMGPFVCDKCRYRHEFARDVGKTILIEPDKHDADYQTCTGQLCRRCTYGDMNRAERRVNPEAACLSECRSGVNGRREGKTSEPSVLHPRAKSTGEAQKEVGG